jgi:hypothetical protein
VADIICHALSPLFSHGGTARDVPAWYATGNEFGGAAAMANCCLFQRCVTGWGVEINGVYKNIKERATTFCGMILCICGLSCFSGIDFLSKKTKDQNGDAYLAFFFFYYYFFSLESLECDWDFFEK